MMNRTRVQRSSGWDSSRSRLASREGAGRFTAHGCEVAVDPLVRYRSPLANLGRSRDPVLGPRAHGIRSEDGRGPS